jgi:hypothetical protein
MSKKTMHYNEDTSKVENRINITLFHLLMNTEIKQIISAPLCEILNLTPQDIVIFPSPNLTSEQFDDNKHNGRPDFRVEVDNSEVAYIEVETSGEDKEQINRFNLTGKYIISIVGRAKDKNNCLILENKFNLSLEEIYNKTKELSYSTTDKQLQKSLTLFNLLIENHVLRKSFVKNKLEDLSSRGTNSKIISYIKNYFSSDNILGISDKISSGRIKLGRKNDNPESLSFSLTVYCRNSKTKKEFALMSRSEKIKDYILFPSYGKLQGYWSEDDRIDYVEQYIDLLDRLGARGSNVITDFNGKKIRKSYKQTLGEEKAQLNVGIIEQNLDEFCRIISKIAGI